MRKIPKVIENLRESLLEEAREELFKEGYHALNIRTVAKRCEVAVGTVYNYFSSKEVLAAHVVLEDWMTSLGRMEESVVKETDLMDGIHKIYNELLKFEKLYHDIFYSSRGVYSKYSSRERHARLRIQLEEPIKELCEKTNHRADTFTYTFLAENLLGASQEQIAFEKLKGIFYKILN